MQQQFQQLLTEISGQIVGQPRLLERILIGLLTGGHLLVEGAPGLAKTRAIKSLADRIEGDFHRLQFTPDLLPADLTGGDIYHQQEGRFEFQPGPIFHHLLLADEINRAPAKVQSALLEAMAEGQVTIGRQSYPLPDLFLVLATQNPLEQEGTYPLPEAQLDRFLFKVVVDYPAADDELAILRLNRQEALAANSSKAQREKALPPLAQAMQGSQLSQVDLFTARAEVMQLHISEPLEQYIVQLVLATRQPEKINEQLARWIAVGVSPRATIGLEHAARAKAWLSGRDFVTPSDIQELAHDVLRHRLVLSFEAEADGISADDVITQLLQYVPAP